MDAVQRRRAADRVREERRRIDEAAFVQLSDFHGFAVVDFQQRKEVSRVTLPEIPVEQQDKGPFNGSPSHGIGVAPDGKTLWVTSRPNHAIYAYSLPDLQLLGSVPVGGRSDWVTFTPDSKLVYVAVESLNAVSAIDVASRKEVARIPVGKEPQAEHHGGAAVVSGG